MEEEVLFEKLRLTFHVPSLSLQRKYLGEDYAVIFHPFSLSILETDPKSALILKLVELGTPISKISELLGIPYGDIKKELDYFYNHIESLKPNEIVDFSKPSEIWIMHTLACNLNCRYCYTRYGTVYERFAGQSDRAIAQIYIKAIDAVYSTFGRDPNFITFYGGGEPLLDFETIKYIIEHVEREGYGYKYGIVTNGTLLRRETAEYLKVHNVLLTISMDGPRLINDLNRIKKDNKGVFDELTRAISILKDLDYDFDIEATYTAEAYELGCTPKDIIEYLSTLSPFIILMQIATYMKTLEGKGSTPQLFHLFIDLIDASFHELSRQKPRYYYLSVILALAMFGRKAIKATICPLTAFLTIFPNGDIMSCHVLSSLVLGNVRSNQLQKDLLLWMERLNNMRNKLTRLIDERYLWLVTLQDICPGQIFDKSEDMISHIEGGKKVVPDYLDYTATIWWDSFILNVAKHAKGGTLEHIYDNISSLALKRRARYFKIFGGDLREL